MAFDHKAYHKQWCAENADKVKGYGKKTRTKVKQQIVEAYGGACACCGETELVFLTVEHTRGDGHAHRKRVNNAVYWDLKRRGFPQDEGLTILCMNCNFARRWGNTCPHQK